MIGGDELRAPVGNEPTPHPANRLAFPQKSARGDRAQGTDNSRLHNIKLSKEIGKARGCFVRQRATIRRRPALEDVADEDIVAVKADGVEYSGKESACAADEGQSLLVFFRAGSLADEDEFSTRIPLPRDHLRSGFPQDAPFAGGHLCCDLR